jgi:hypothetical protein
MATFIQSCLVLARNHFGMALAYSKPQLAAVQSVIPVAMQRDEIAYLFNRKLLTTGTLVRNLSLYPSPIEALIHL